LKLKKEKIEKKRAQFYYNFKIVMNFFFKITELQNQNESLKNKLTELNELCTLCSTKMQANIGLIQDEVASKSPDLNNDDLFLLAIAGLKQVSLDKIKIKEKKYKLLKKGKRSIKSVI
jgi:hypothetical protein